MATNQRRRSTERQLLQRQLEERRTREARRRRMVLVISIVGTLVIIAAVVVGVVVGTSGGDDTKSGGGSPSCSKSGFLGVTLTNPCNVAKDPAPKIDGQKHATPTKLQIKDVIVGKGKAAAPTSSVQVQYSGMLYASGKIFDASWKRGQAASFSLQQVVPGFTQGIGGTKGVAPMKVGGRRIIILPGALGYGSQGSPQAGIGPNAPLVFVVDLKSVT